MRTSETIADLLADLIKCQAKISNPPANCTNDAFKKGNNPGSKYADLAALRDATMEHLIQSNLVIVQTTEIDGNGNFLCVARLYHKSGQWIECDYPLPATGTTQQIGSALTYARRYTWSALIGVYCDKDDDGNAAEAASKARGNGNMEQAFSKRTMNTLSKAGEGGPSAYVSKGPYGMLSRDMESLDSLDALNDWFDRSVEDRKLINPSWERRLLVEFHKKALEVAHAPEPLKKWWKGYKSFRETLRELDQEMADDLDDRYQVTLDGFNLGSG